MSTQITAAPDSDPRPSKASGGFFSLYKPGQGYWTRLGTALGASAIILFISWFVFSELAVFAMFSTSGRRYAIAAGVAAVLAIITWVVMNNPKRAQFLIDTDSELKKVNWAGWTELLGSTRVVVAFMLLTAFVLFLFDTQFHAFFHTLTIWAIPFDGIAGLVTGVVVSLVLLAVGVALLRSAEATRRSKLAAYLCLIAGALILASWVVYVIKNPGLFSSPSAVPAAG